ncbi:MAG: hypothetical protein WCL22_06605 [bacterium]
MKTIIGLLTLVFFGRFADKRMTMAEGSLFVLPQILVRIKMIGGSSKDKNLDGVPSAWTDTVYVAEEFKIDPLGFFFIEKFILDHPVKRLPMERTRSPIRDLPVGNQSTHPYEKFFR